MKTAILSLSAAFLLLASAHTATAQNGDEIITKHIAAIGGEAAWAKVKAVRMTGSVNAMGMEVPAVVTIVDNKAMRLNMNMMGMDGFLIIKEGGGWMYMPFQPGMDKVMPLPEGQLGDLSGKLSYKKLQLVDKSEIASATYIGNDTLDNVTCYKVTVKGKDDMEATAYFDANTYYIVRMEAKKAVKDEKQEEVAFSFSNFQKQAGGIVVPMVQSGAAMGGDMTVKKFEVNPTVADSYFDANAAAAAMKKGSTQKEPAAKKETGNKKG